MTKILVCGTRKKNLPKEKIKESIKHAMRVLKGTEFIEGCCPESPDVLAEEVAEELLFKCNHFPANPGNYLKRNMEMISEADGLIAFWDGWSYGTAHTIAHAIKKNIPFVLFDHEGTLLNAYHKTGAIK